MENDNLGPLDPVLEAEIRTMIAQGNTIAAIKRVRESMGCGLSKAHEWVDRMIQAGGFTIRNESTGKHCPYCGKPLATDRAKQCFSCGMDWHDPDSVVKH
jgi:hypothetical protein